MKCSKSFFLFLTVFVLLFVSFGSASITVASISDTVTCKTSCATVLSLNIGEGVGEVGYSYSSAQNFGPEGFYVNGETIYILDTINNRIQCYKSGNFSKTYQIPNCVYATHFCIADDGFVVFDATMERLIIFGEESETIYLDLPSELSANYVQKLEYNDGNVIITTIKLDKYYAKLGSSDGWKYLAADISIDNTKGGLSLTSNGKTRTIVAKANEEVVYLDENSEHLYLAVYEFVPELPIIKTELTVRRCDSTGKTEYAVIDKLGWIAHPLNNFFLADDTAYMLVCEASEVRIVALNFGNRYVSNMEFLTEQAQEKVAIVEAASIHEKETAADLKALGTRTSTLTRAKQAANLVWTIKDEHNNARPGVELPNYVKDKAEGTKLTGIPYARGGYFSSVSGFTDKLDDQYTDGKLYNTGNTGNSMECAIGFDCSGFVSYAYGISRKTTAGFATYGYALGSGNHKFSSTQISCLKSMDFLIRYNVDGENNHVVLFSKQVSSIYPVQIYDSSSLGTAGRVSSREVTYGYLEDFVMRSPWSCAANNSCVAGVTYASNAYYHWNTCLTCGLEMNYSEHLWTAYGSQYKCTICKRVSATPTLPTALIDINVDGNEFDGFSMEFGVTEPCILNQYPDFKED